MATTYKVLGQLAPSATTDTDLYTVPAATQTVVSTIVITNRSNSAATYNIAVRPAGATLANEMYVAYNVTVGANDGTALTIGLTLEATDVVTVQASSADLSFNLFGSELT